MSAVEFLNKVNAGENLGRQWQESADHRRRQQRRRRRPGFLADGRGITDRLPAYPRGDAERKKKRSMTPSKRHQHRVPDRPGGDHPRRRQGDRPQVHQDGARRAR